jgi:hypothetical protein
MHRCENPLCNDLINRHRPHHKLGDAFFCSAECAKEWVDSNNSMLRAARSFLDQPALHSSSSQRLWGGLRNSLQR